MIDELPGGVQPERFRRLNRLPERRGDYVLYWMQQSARSGSNHALEYAALQANLAKIPLLVCFVLTSDYPHANLRHYRFLVEGLVETAQAVEARGARFILRLGDPAAEVATLARRTALVVVDSGFLPVQRRWRADAAALIEAPVVEIESDVVVPVAIVSAKEEYSAATIRRKIHRLLPEFLMRPQTIDLAWTADGVDVESVGLAADEAIDATLSSLDIDRSVPAVSSFHGGRRRGLEVLQRFIAERLPGYDELRNDPSQGYQSGLSPWIHFGQLSSLEIALAVLDDEAAQDRSALVDGVWVPGRLAGSAAAFLEELIVRRELAVNFVRYSDHHDSYACLPAWAMRSLDSHRSDHRPVVYSPERLEAGDTHDEYWNAAQREMVVTGKMHGYLRMYWGKKVIEWSKSPEEAYRTLVELNDRYSLDGRDANGYAGIAWCFGKHDRPWQEREIFGMIRYMNAKGLERKFDMREYLRMVSETTAREATR